MKTQVTANSNIFNSFQKLVKPNTTQEENWGSWVFVEQETRTHNMLKQNKCNFSANRWEALWLWLPQTNKNTFCL